MSKTKKTGDKPSNDNRQWSVADDKLLLDLMARHVPKDQMALVLGRTLRAVGQRLWEQHGDAWRSSGHPEAGQVKPTTEIGRLEAKLDELLALVRPIARALGDAPAETAEVRPNGRAHS